MGRLAGDDKDLLLEHTKGLADIRKRSMDALLRDNTPELFRIAYEAVKWMENLPSNHTMFFPSYIAFINDPSPWSPLFEDCLRKVFSKVGDSVGRKDRNIAIRPNNASGSAIWGARGTGKSNGLRLLTLVPPLMFPNNVVSAYIDYTSYSKLPSSVLAEALKESGVPVPPRFLDTRDLERVLDHAGQHNKTLILCADEMEHVYTNKRIWDQFSMLATRYDHTLFLADSSSKVRAMVECKGHETSLRRWFPQFEGTVLPSTLNEDKLAIRELHPFTRPEQYHALFAKREVPIWQKTHGQCPSKVVESIHHVTGGRLRAMQRNENYPMVTLPRSDSAAFYVLSCLQQKQLLHGWTSSFELESFTEEEVLECLADWRKLNPHLAAKDDTMDVNALLDHNYLVMTKTGTFTFAVPAYYDLLLDIRPHVFISHAWADKDHPMLKSFLEALKVAHVNAVIDFHPATQRVMAECPLKQWMEKQVTSNGFVVALMTEEYKKRAAIYDSGVQYEIELLNQHQNNKNVRVLAVSLDQCFSKDPDSWKSGSLSILGSRLVQEMGNKHDIEKIVRHILNNSSIAANEKQ